MNFREHYFEQVPMTRQQVMDYLQIGKSALHEYMSEDGLPYIRMGNRLRFWKKDVDDWLNSKKVQTKSEQNGTNQHQNGTQHVKTSTKAN